MGRDGGHRDPVTPLSGITVVEVGGSLAAAFCGRLLRDFGADVIKVEPPGGDGSAPELDTCLSGYLDHHKRSITLDPSLSDGEELFERLCAHAGIVLWGPAGLEAPSLPAPEALAARHEGLVVVAITPYGRTGPYRDLRGSELLVEALAGLVGVTPRLPTGSEREPLKAPGHLGAFMGALHGAFAAMAWLQSSTDAGVCIDIAEVETLLSGTPPLLTMGGGENSPSHRDPAMGWHLAPCKDGYVLIAHGMNPPWEALKAAMGYPDWAEDERFADAQGRTQHLTDLCSNMQPWLDAHTRDELWQRFRETGSPCAPVLSPSESAALHQHRDRDFFLTLARAEGPDVLVPGAAHTPRPPVADTVAAPERGGDNEAVWRDRLGLSDHTLDTLRERGVV